MTIADSTPEWLRIAETQVGVKELPGKAQNKQIVAYHASTKLKATDDETPWCSAFVNWCVTKSGLKGTDSAAAISWLSWGQEMKIPAHGCIVVMRRGDKPWQGHVGFYLGKNASGTKIQVLGGNQGDAVKVVEFPASKVLSYRWPIGHTK